MTNGLIGLCTTSIIMLVMERWEVYFNQKEIFNSVIRYLLIFHYLYEISRHVCSLHVNLERSGIGIKLINYSSNILHLMFIDDCLTFGRANKETEGI